VHGDAHAGNIFRDPHGPGLIDWQLLQSGGWALDVAYHIAAVLPVEVVEVEERALLAHYLSEMAALGCAMPDAETAWRQYREAPAYGYYLWSITRRVDPAIIDVFVERLGKAVVRHDTFALLGVA
jgi:aminoglycoside phosphotransferase (APT) family kinase protein